MRTAIDPVACVHDAPLAQERALPDGAAFHRVVTRRADGACAHVSFVRALRATIVASARKAITASWLSTAVLWPETGFAQGPSLSGTRITSRDSAYSVTIPDTWQTDSKASAVDAVIHAPGHRSSAPCDVRFVTAPLEAAYANTSLAQLADAQSRMIRDQVSGSRGLQLTESSFRTVRDQEWWVFKGQLMQGKTLLRVLNYKTIEAGRVYMMTYACPDEHFAGNIPQVLGIIESLEFDPRIRQQRASVLATSAPTPKTQREVVSRTDAGRQPASVAQSQQASGQEPPQGRSQATTADRASVMQGAGAAGTIAPDAIRLEVDAMSPFFGGHAVIVKANAQALINDKGAVVVPYNTYRFTRWEIDRSNSNEIGRTFYLESQHGALVEFRRGVPSVKVIPFQDIKSNALGYIVRRTGAIVLRKPSNRRWLLIRNEASWLGGFDELGYVVDGWNDTFSDDGLLVSQRYDGTEIVGRGHRRSRPRGQPTEHFNFELQGYATPMSDGRGGTVSVASLWTNGLTPARSASAQSPYLVSRDPAQVRAARNTSVGLINRKGEFQIPPNFLDVGPFSEGIAFVSRVDEFDQLTWGAIDTLGKLVIPYRYRLMPGRFSHGVAIVRAIDVDSLRYAFINKRGEIVFTIRPSHGDTLSISLGLNNEFAEYAQQRFEGFERFYFMEGVQWVRLALRDAARPREPRAEVALLDSLGRYTPIERLILQHLPPGGRIEFLPRIRDGQFLFSYTGKGTDPLTGNEAELRGKLGIADIRGNIIVPPRFTELSLFDSESRLQYAQVGGDNREAWNPGIQGYIDRTGVFRIVKGKQKSGF